MVSDEGEEQKAASAERLGWHDADASRRLRVSCQLSARTESIAKGSGNHHSVRFVVRPSGRQCRMSSPHRSLSDGYTIGLGKNDSCCPARIAHSKSDDPTMHECFVLDGVLCACPTSVGLPLVYDTLVIGIRREQ